MTGRTLGHYVVVGDRLGAGGMGEVYRVRDTHLERDVALKVLSSGAAARSRAARRSAEPPINRLSRFDEAEASYKTFPGLDALGWEPQHA